MSMIGGGITLTRQDAAEVRCDVMKPTYGTLFGNRTTRTALGGNSIVSELNTKDFLIQTILSSDDVGEINIFECKVEDGLIKKGKQIGKAQFGKDGGILELQGR